MCMPKPGPRCLHHVQKQHDLAVRRLEENEAALDELWSRYPGAPGASDPDQALRVRLSALKFRLNSTAARLSDELADRRLAAERRQKGRKTPIPPAPVPDEADCRAARGAAACRACQADVDSGDALCSSCRAIAQNPFSKRP